MNRFWSLLFLTVPILGVATMWWGYTNDLWMPRDISRHGHQIDHLFHFILFLTGAVFVGTEVVLFLFLWKYQRGGPASGQPVKYTHGSHNLEIVWTILPAATLLFIAIYQMNAWADVKIRHPGESRTPLVEVTARQFEWRLRYPGADGQYNTLDDIHLVNDLHVPVDEQILIELKSMDVLHDFFLPHLRIKQDAVPGMRIPIWFTAKEEGTYDLVCAELCGWGHYKMKGRLTVEPRAQFEAWLAAQAVAQEATADAPNSDEEDAE